MTYYSQIGQDRWVQSVLGDKYNGYFVELGACDGVKYSNTLFFEREREWNGICIEPNDLYLPSLRSNRSCSISNELIYSVEGQELNFSWSEEASGVLDENAGPFTRRDHVVKKRTTTLERVLESAKAPQIMDYLSLDVEGQEYNILSTFPFHKYVFRCMTVEHNAPHVGPEQQRKIRELLERNGYRYVKGNDDVHGWGHGPIDDFYINPNAI
jgi:hypothetical protein